MWWYSLGTIAQWVLNPEIRRIWDLFFGFSAVEVLAVLPLLGMVPHIWSLTYGGGWRRVPPQLAIAAWIWIGGFSYGLVTAILSGNLVPGVYEFATFVFPMVLGLWIAADETPFSLAYSRITRVVFVLATVTSVYGIIQYVLAPLWDANWLQTVIKAGTTSFGLPFPYQIRVFSTLNDPLSFALFIAAAMLLALPELSLRKPLLLAGIPFWCIAFGLSLVRTGWITFGIGALVYLVLSPRRISLISTFAVTAALVTALVVVLPAAVGNDQMLTSLTSRFATLSDLDEDKSRQDRQELYSQAPLIFSTAPFGVGLGVLGGSTRLGAKGVTTDFDSGYLGRTLEMGIPGLILYCIPQLLLLFASLKLWSNARLAKNIQLQAAAAVSVGLIVAFVFLQFGHDVNGFPTLMYWLIECLAISALNTGTQRATRVAYA